MDGLITVHFCFKPNRIMKLFKNKLIWLLAGITLIVSCEPDNEPVEDNDVRDRFIGRWSCTENSNISGDRTFFVDIDYDTSSTNKIELINFYSMGNNVFALGEVSTTNEQAITIPSQDLDGLTTQGSGTMDNNDLLTFNYVVDDGVEIDSIQATFIRE